ncbi:asparagine synthase (glutamine-hydrolyzing) [Tissierella creatinini]|nr:asparagine synthase (glutamine-hydrolyzing) [Tissierella creatinini]TJX62218.1 asparagine synthase (glutamine-hydrolyzing) [Soehngenia saccharolytica]
MSGIYGILDFHDNEYFRVREKDEAIFNEDNSLLIVCEGIIYNYKSLKQELEDKGHIFSTQVQSEVVLHCFEEYGADGFNKLRGKYSFVIYDSNEKRAIIVRDLAGEKPLYYYHDKDFFIFSSDIKSIINSGIVRKEINKKALNQYLQLTYIPAPLTIYSDIYKLLPGHYITLELNKDVAYTKYWDVEYNKDDKIQDYNKCKELLRTTLFNAVEDCMSSSKLIGTLLSGGIDSTIITGIASQVSNKSLDTFTIGYMDKRHDESDRAKLSSKFHKSIQHIFYLEYEDVFPDLDKIINNLEEPFADSSYIPTYMIAKYAKEYVDIALTGDAGDEIFGGYDKYLIGHYSERYNRMPKAGRDIFKKGVYAMPDKSNLSRKVRKVIENSELDIFTQRKNLMCLGFKEYELSKLLTNSFVEPDALEIVESCYNSQINDNDELSKALYTDFKIVLEGDMMPKSGIASCLTSLETRLPILHKDVVELAAKIPNKFKINNKNTKIIFKDTFKDLIPEKILKAKKRGFSVPIGSWFKHELKEDLLYELDKQRIEEQGIFNHECIEKVLNEHFTMTKDRSNELWVLYIFQKWYSKNVRN